jgi:hypothetical protein
MLLDGGHASLCPPYELLPSLRAQRSNPRVRKPRYGLFRCARNDDVEVIGAAKPLVGQITKSLSSPFCKNISLSLSGKSAA